MKLIATPIVLIFAALVLIAQNTTQVSLSDAQRASYWRAQYELQLAECTAEKARSSWKIVIDGTCPAGQSISTATQTGEPTCVPAPAAAQ